MAYSSYNPNKGYNSNYGGGSQSGMKFSKESRQKMSNSAKSIHIGKLNGKAKAIDQYDLNNQFIKHWDCIIDVEKTLGIKVTAICNNLKGYCKQSGGYIWKYSK